MTAEHLLWALIVAALLCLTFQVVNLWRRNDDLQAKIAMLDKSLDVVSREENHTADIHAKAISALQEQINELRDA